MRSSSGVRFCAIGKPISTARPGRSGAGRVGSPRWRHAVYRLGPAPILTLSIQADRKSVVEGKSVAVSVDLGGRRNRKKIMYKQSDQDRIDHKCSQHHNKK